jgi:polysaccharide biosynthesis transport protein
MTVPPNRPPMNNRPTAAARPPQARGLNIGDLYYMLFRHKWKIIILTLMGLGAAYGVKYVVEVPYHSEARLLVRFVLGNEEVAAFKGDANLKSPDQRGETIMAGEVQILTSFDLARQVAQAVGPARILGSDSADDDLLAAAAVVHRGLDVQTAPRSSVIRIGFLHPNPEVAQPVLRELISAYSKTHASVHRGSSMVNDFLNQQTDQLRARLAQTEEDLRKATATLGVVSIEDARKNYSDQIARIEESIFSAQADLAERAAIARQFADLQSPQPTSAQDAPVPRATTSVVMQYQAVINRLDFLRQRQQSLLAQFTPESTRVQEVTAQMEAAAKEKQRLEVENPSLAMTASVAPGDSRGGTGLQAENARLHGLDTRIKVLSSQLESVRQRVRELDEAEANIVQLQRRKELEETNYRRYAASLEQSRISEALGAGRVSNISVIQSATPAAPDASKVSKFKKMAAVGGLALALGWIGLIEFILDRSVRRPMDVVRNVNLPLFVTIPRLTKKQLKTLAKHTPSTALAIPADETAPPGLAEIIALQPFHETLRDRMISFFEAKGLTHKPKLVAVTSIGADTGASTTATGLARSLSETGDGNVLLVDMTPGQQTAQQFHRGKSMRGLEETLAIKNDRVQVEENLYLAGSGTDNELLRTLPRQFNKLLPKLRGSDFDYIIFDMPPVSQISVTPRVAGFMDMTFMVVESEKTSRDALQRAGEMLTEAGATVGVVLNKNRSYVPTKLDHEVLT